MERLDKITLAQVSKLIDDNQLFSAELNLRLSFGITNKKFYGAIFDGEQKIFYKTYEGQHTHILIAQLHIDFNTHMKRVDIARKRVETLRLIEERKSIKEKEAEQAWQVELEERKKRFRQSGLLD